MNPRRLEAVPARPEPSRLTPEPSLVLPTNTAAFWCSYFSPFFASVRLNVHNLRALRLERPTGIYGRPDLHRQRDAATFFRRLRGRGRRRDAEDDLEGRAGHGPQRDLLLDHCRPTDDVPLPRNLPCAAGADQAGVQPDLRADHRRRDLGDD